MIHHLALFRFEPGTGQAAIGALMAAIDALPQASPGIVRFARGLETGGRADGHTHAVSIVFRDRAALEAFNTGDAHRAMVEQHLKPITAHLLVAEFDDGDGRR